MSVTLLLQSAIGGVLLGGIYGLLAMGLTLSWGLLRLVNLSHFALAFLCAYMTYHAGTVLLQPLWLAVLVLIPLFFLIGVLMHAVLVHFKVTEFASMLVTFGLTVLIESVIQIAWTADFRKYEVNLGEAALRIGGIYVPTLELVAFLCAVVLAITIWIGLHKTMVGRALRASAQDGAIAAAFGVNSVRLSYLLAGLCCATAAVAGVFIALTSTLAPSQIEAWIGVVFAVVIIASMAGHSFVFKGALMLAVVLAIGSYLTFVLGLSLQFQVWPSFITG